MTDRTSQNEQASSTDSPVTGRPIFTLIAGCAIGLFVATIAFGLFWRLGTGAGSSQSRTLTLAHGLEPTHPVHLVMVRMGERLEEISGGRLKLTIYHSGQLGSETDLLEQVQAGALDMTKTSTSPLESFVPDFAIFAVPYVFRDHAHCFRVLDGPIGQRLLLAGEKAGVRGLCYYDAGARSFYTIEKPVLKPSDLRGMKIRVQKSKTAMDMVQVLGGLPTPIAWGELYTALQQRMVDGAENNPPSLLSSRHYEVAPYYALDEHAFVPDMVVIGTRTWDSLSEQERRWVQQAADESSAYEREVWAKSTVEALATMQKAGLKVFEVDKKPFIQAVEPMIRSYDGTPMGQLIQEISDTP